jgi:(R,R)-butanediol dehydrogenase/meso-butanediol dehydrogenase/diacetyl reductase
MRAAVIETAGALAIREVDQPTPGRGAVLVKIEYCGICGTDLHSVLDGWAPAGTIVGHEWSGRVVALGPAVEGWHEGELVVGGPPWCGRCEWCLNGRPALCAEDPLRTGRTSHPGAFAEYRVAPAGSLHRAPPSLDPRTAALAEPLAVALHGLTAAGDTLNVAGVRAFVSGAGPLGLLIVAALAERGVTDLVVAEPSAARREQAVAAGAASAVDPSDLPATPETPTQCRDDGFDVGFESSGRAAAIGTALGLLRPAGRLVLLGTGSMSVRLDPLRILLNELVVTGAYAYDPHGIDDALILLASGRLPIDALLSPDDISLDHLLDTMRQLRIGEIPRKVLVRP